MLLRNIFTYLPVAIRIGAGGNIRRAPRSFRSAHRLSRGVSWFSSLPPRGYLLVSWNRTSASLHVLSISSFINHLTIWYCRSRDSSVGIETGWTAGVRFPAEKREFSLLHGVQTGSGAHPATYPTGAWSSIPGGKRPGPEADRSPPSIAQVKNGGAIPPLPHMSSRRSASLIRHRDSFIFYQSIF
jgi:hypothetical protein